MFKKKIDSQLLKVYVPHTQTHTDNEHATEFTMC